MRFVIDAPPYRNSSAGVRVLHRLCHLLNQAGEDACVTNVARHPEWSASSAAARHPERSALSAAAFHPRWKTWTAALRQANCNTSIAAVRQSEGKPSTVASIGDDTVVIYPETVSGNPLGARRVVRYYALSRAGAVTHGAAAAAGELVVYLDDWLREAASQAAGTALGRAHRLFISVLEPDLFFPARGVRLVDCVHVGRNAELARTFPGHAPPWRYRITDTAPSTRNGLAALLRRTRRLYAYDSGSALPFEAALSGARVLAVQADGTLEPSLPWETHDLVCRWWDAGLPNVRAFIALVRAHWPG